ncbi:hypothetical protein HP440_03725 [Bacillus altitudinis]|nr:hypothetical protein [Bacillus altitudinis]
MGVTVLKYLKDYKEKIKKNKFYVALSGLFFVSLIVSIFIHAFVNPTVSYNFQVVSIFLLMYAFIIHSIFKINPEYPIRPKNIYEWLNNPILYDQDPILSESKYKEIDKKNLMENLDYFRNQLLAYTKHDLTNLRMLKAYVRTKNSDGNSSTIKRTLLTLISGPLFVFVIREDAVINYFNVPEANQSLISIMVYILIFLSFVFVLISIILFFSGNKGRFSFIEEMVEVCIKDLEEENNKSL